jgi:hypothetical protein
MTKAIHEKYPDAMAVYTVATQLEGIPAISGYRRAASGAYGPTFHIGRVLCASVTELKKRGIVKEKMDARQHAQWRVLAECLGEVLCGDFTDAERLKFITVLGRVAGWHNIDILRRDEVLDRDADMLDRVERIIDGHTTTHVGPPQAGDMTNCARPCAEHQHSNKDRGSDRSSKTRR